MTKIKKVADILKMLASDQGLSALNYKRLSLVIGNAQRSYWGELRNRFEKTQKTTDDVRPFIEIDSNTTTNPQGRFALPSNYGTIASISIGASEKEVDIVKESEVTARLDSELSPPSAESPFGVMRGNFIQFYPKQEYNQIMLVYMRTPVEPSIGRTIVSNREIYSEPDTVDLEVVEASLDEIIRRAALEIGVSLKDQGIAGYNQIGLQNEQPQ